MSNSNFNSFNQFDQFGNFLNNQGQFNYLNHDQDNAYNPFQNNNLNNTQSIASSNNNGYSTVNSAYPQTPLPPTPMNTLPNIPSTPMIPSTPLPFQTRTQQQQQNDLSSSSSFQQPPATPAFQSNNYRQNNFTQPQFPHQTGFTRPNSPYLKNHNNNINNNFNDDDPDNLYSAPTPISAPTPMMPPLSPISAPTPMMAPVPLSAPTPQLNYNSAANRQQLFNAPTPQPQLLSAPTPSTAMFNAPTPVSYEPPQTPSFDAPTPQQHYSQLSSTDFPSTPQVNFNATMNYNSQPQFSANVTTAFNAPTPYTVPTPYNQPQTPFSASTPFNPPQTPYSAPTPYYNNNNNNNSENNGNVNYQQQSQFTNNTNEPQLPPHSLLQSTEGNQNSHHTNNSNKNNNDLFQNPIIPQTPMYFENEFKQPPHQYEFQAPSIPPLQRQYNSYQDDLYKVDSSNTSSEPISLNYNQQAQLKQQYQQPHSQPQQHQQRKQKPSKQHTKKPPVPQPPQTTSKKPSPSITPSHRQPQKTSAQPLPKPKETPIIPPKPLNKMRKISMRSQNNSLTEGSNNPSMTLSSNTKSFVIPEKTEKTTVFMSPIKKGRSLKLIDDNDDKDDLMVTTGEDRKVHQTNFEEAIRMATDNKINSVNSWNFALIDYFHDMNLLRENEGGSINFQKAGATLEGCMKIYSHRVDSVAVDTGKLLSGLGKKGEDEDSDNNDNDDIEDDSKSFNVGANGNHIITNGNAHSANGDPNHINGTNSNHVDVSGNKKGKLKIPRKTLVEKFSTLQLRKFETELNIDPLFKKTLAEFDEGGTSALLLNSLHIDIDGRIVFDASTPSRGVGNNDKENPDSSKDKSTARDDDEKAESDTIIDTIKDDGNDGILGGLAMESDLKDEAEGDDGEFEKFGNLKMLLNSSLNNDEIDIDDCAVCHSITELENVLKDSTKLKKFLQDINGTANITQDLSELNDGEESSDGLDEGDKLMEDKDVVLLDNFGTFDDFNDDIGLPDTINEEDDDEGEGGDRAASHKPNGKDTKDGTGSEADGMDNKYRSTSAEYLKEEDRELIDFFDKSSKKSWGGQKDSNGNWKVSQYKRKLGKLDSNEDGHHNNDGNDNDDEENDNDGEDDEDEEFNGKKRKAKKGKKNGKLENNKKLKFQNDNDDAIIDFVNISYIPKDQLDKEMIEEETVLFARPKKPSAINMPMDSRISTESTILPEDMHYTSVKLTKTFIKPTLNIGLFTKKRKINNSNKGLMLNQDGYKLKLNKGGIGFYDDNEDDEFDDDEDDNGGEGGEEGSNKSKKSNFIIDEKIWARKYEEKQEIDEKNDNTKSDSKNGNGGDFFNDFDDGFHNNALYDDDDDDDDGEKIGTFDIPITQPAQVNDEVSNALDKIPAVVGTAATTNKTSDPALSTSEGNVTARELNTTITNNGDKNGDSLKPLNNNAKTPTGTKEEKKVSFPVKPKVSFEFGRKQLSYAKKAKKINVKFLKDNLWKAVMRKEHIENIKLQREKQKNKTDLLSKSDTTINANKDKETEEKEGEFKEQFIETSLSELAKDVSKNYENKDKKELSTSFFFICMLHLANEHGLEIKNNGDYSDLTISKPEN
ncbi:hypothetical protein B5S33_g1501 [[Candida] boidinii]|nr:hypothetical protein B5S33_g1501 [[Candida] boidinii]